MAHRCGGDRESRQKKVPIGMHREVVARQKCTPVVAQENRPHGQTPPTEKQPTHSPPLRPGAYRPGRNAAGRLSALVSFARSSRPIGDRKSRIRRDFDSDEEDPRKVRRAKLKRIGRSNADDEQEKSKGADDEQEKSKGEKAKDLAEITPEELVALINKKAILPKVFVNPNEVLLNPLSGKQQQQQSHLSPLTQPSS